VVNAQATLRFDAKFRGELARCLGVKRKLRIVVKRTSMPYAQGRTFYDADSHLCVANC
jgi:hypothetical protein